MRLRGLGIKAMLRRVAVKCVKMITPYGIIYNSPKSYLKLDEARKTETLSVQIVRGEEKVIEQLPEIFNYELTGRFKRYSSRTIPEAYVLQIDSGLVYGRFSNIIMFSPQTIVTDVSREFGAYGGKPIREYSLLASKFRIQKAQHINGNLAVITTIGADNFHHWLYDCLPRIHLLISAGIFESIDWFLISNSGAPFQNEAIKKMKIPSEKIINPQINGVSHYSADKLIVPSLPSVLGTVSPWVVSFLRDFYQIHYSGKQTAKIFISRKHVKTRHIINSKEFSDLLKEFGIIEIFPEDYSVSDFGHLIARSKFIISVHGSGLSNLFSLCPNTTVVDILAPYHQDCYYWLISNIRRSKYIGFFAEGPHPQDEVDLVRNKQDDDLEINCIKLRELFVRELSGSV